jgi:hypothetical protein
MLGKAKAQRIQSIAAPVARMPRKMHDVLLGNVGIPQSAQIACDTLDPAMIPTRRCGR